MKKVFVLVMALSFVMVCSSVTEAYRVKVKNDTNVKIGMWLQVGVGWNHNLDADLEPGATHTFETDKCPKQLYGFLYDRSSVLYDRCTNGNEGLFGVCSLTCWGSDWTIRSHSDGWYHFDKE